MSVTLTYVYCLVRDVRPPAIGELPAHVPGGGAVRAVEIERPLIGSATRAGAGGGTKRAAVPRHWLIVSTVPGRAYGEEALQRGLQRLEWVGERAVAHEAVVEHFLSARAVLPMQLFTLFTNDERAVEHVVTDRRRIARILSRVERQVEWGLRLMWDERAVRDAVASPLPGARGARGAGTGAAYLARKRDLLDITRGQLTTARRHADRVYRTLSREASDARRRTATERAAPGSRLLLDAAFLVPAGRAGAFRAAVRRNARSLAGSSLSVSLTGPWPPYNFI